ALGAPYRRHVIHRYVKLSTITIERVTGRAVVTDLASAPTRRSSDLVRRPGQDGPPVGIAAVKYSAGGFALAKTIQRARSRQRNIDRQSTRLNSSHGSISYGVCCLKQRDSTRREA